MTPEQRAKELCERSDGLVSPKGGFASLIALAIRQAENEAYEKAAKAAIGLGPAYVEIGPAGEWLPGLPYDRGRADAADAIRSLKHPST